MEMSPLVQDLEEDVLGSGTGMSSGPFPAL